jgi:putative acetyltransferase
VFIRREQATDVAPIRDVVAAAFREVAHSAPPVDATGDPGEVALVAWLRADPAWIPGLSLVAVEGEQVVGHVVCSRGFVDDQPALGLGPVSVLPHHQGAGVGSALMHAVLGAAEAQDETLVALLGDPAYYTRFGFVPASALSIAAPEPAWDDYFQARPLTAYDGRGGTFRYAAPFGRL